MQWTNLLVSTSWDKKGFTLTSDKSVFAAVQTGLQHDIHVHLPSRAKHGKLITIDRLYHPFIH